MSFKGSSPSKAIDSLLTLFYLLCHHLRSWTDKHWLYSTAGPGGHQHELVSGITTRHIRMGVEELLMDTMERKCLHCTWYLALVLP